MDGVATPQQAAAIRQMLACIDMENSPVTDLLDVARLLIDPMYDYERGIEILLRIRDRDQSDPWVIYWYSYCVLHYLIDSQSVLRAIEMIQSWLDSEFRETDAEAGAALLQMLIELCAELGPQKCPSQTVELLTESVRLSPGWTYNRWLLAAEYCACGRYDDASQQLDSALANMLPYDPSWDMLTEQFETIVTGRAGSYIADRFKKEEPGITARARCEVHFRCE
jgi:tetratricopeptide (TPR) repeat protein